jgi:hypothetical protein
MNRTTILLILFLAAGASMACQETEPAEAIPEDISALRFELVPERMPAEGEALWLEVRIGPLPAASTVRVSDAGGEELAVISPYGSLVREQGGSHLVPLPESKVSEEPILVRVQLRDEGGELRRPTKEELVELRLVYVPVE